MSCTTPPASPSEPRFLYKLSPIIPRPHLIKLLCRLPTNPPTHPDPSDATFPFVEIDLATRHAIHSFLTARHEKGFFIPLPFPSAKCLTGRLALGQKMQVSPSQEEYPVSYFLYGSLACPSGLAQVCGIAEAQAPFTVVATVCDGDFKYLRGKMPVLVDREGGRLEGKMYVVKNAEEEGKLRECMGSHFEVVKCTMEIYGGRFRMEGCTFRYCGPEEEFTDRMS